MFTLLTVCVLAVLGSAHAQSCGEVTISSGTCSYTISSSGGGGDSGSCADCSGIESALQSQNANLQALVNRVTTLENEDPPECDCPASGGGGSGAGSGSTYVRWGRTECPETAELIYIGQAANHNHGHHGGGSNFQCLPEDPEFPDGATAGAQSGSYLYGTEYQHQNSPVWSTNLHDHNVPCAVCAVTGRGRHLMIPAKLTCPDGWTEEYSGLLVASHSSHTASSIECLDGEPEVIPGGQANQDGALFYIVESMCGSLNCPPYTDGYELGCVVCTA